MRVANLVIATAVAATVLLGCSSSPPPAASPSTASATPGAESDAPLLEKVLAADKVGEPTAKRSAVRHNCVDTRFTEVESVPDSQTIVLKSRRTQELVMIKLAGACPGIANGVVAFRTSNFNDDLCQVNGEVYSPFSNVRCRVASISVIEQIETRDDIRGMDKEEEAKESAEAKPGAETDTNAGADEGAKYRASVEPDKQNSRATSGADFASTHH